jgi:hypothetical protein
MGHDDGIVWQSYVSEGESDAMTGPGSVNGEWEPSSEHSDEEYHAEDASSHADPLIGIL